MSESKLADVTAFLSDNKNMDTELSPFFKGDSLVMSAPLRWGELRLDGAEQNSGAMAMAALTVIKASYQHVETLTATQANAKLGLSRESALPQGFYVLTAAGKIAAGLFPSIPGEETSFDSCPNDEASAFERLTGPGGLLSDALAPGAFSCDLRFNPEKLFADQRNFPAALMSDASSAKELLGQYGFGARARRFGGSGWELPKKGYPVFMDFGAVSHSQTDGARNYEVPFIKCGGMPVFNHCGYSSLNNIRELRTAKERKKERAEIFSSMIQRWAEARMTMSGGRDDVLMAAADYDNEQGDFWETHPEELKKLREQACAREAKQSMGSERQVVCNPEKTSFFSDPSGCMIGSLDCALVDGQHSSVDYALLAHAVQVSSFGGSDLDWMGRDLDIKESAPSRLKAKFESVMRAGQKTTLKSLGWGQGDGQQDALWQDFAFFCQTVTATVRVTEEANPSAQAQKIKEANNRTAQKAEAEAMLERKREIAEFTTLVNERASQLGEPYRLAEVKSLLTNAAFSGGSAKATIEFEKIFPILNAICATPANGERSTFSKDHLGEGSSGAAELSKQLAEVFELRKNSVLLPSLMRRAELLIAAVTKYKSRSFKLNDKNLELFFGLANGSARGLVDHIAAQFLEIDEDGLTKGKKGRRAFNHLAFKNEAEQIAESQRARKGVKFPKMRAQIEAATRVLLTGSDHPLLDRADRSLIAYALFKRALDIYQAINAPGPKGKGDLSDVMSPDLKENVMLVVARAAQQNNFAGADGFTALSINSALTRVWELKETGHANGKLNLNTAREALIALVNKAKTGAGFTLADMSPQALGLLLDAMPVGDDTQSLAPVIESALEKKRERAQAAELAKSAKSAETCAEPSKGIANRLGARRTSPANGQVIAGGEIKGKKAG